MKSMQSRVLLILSLTVVSVVAYYISSSPSISSKRSSISHSCIKLSAVAAATPSMEKSNFLTYDIASKIKSTHETPIFVYDEETLRRQASTALAFPNMYGLTVRFAMKACPNAAILQLFNSMGLNFDASSGYEVERAVKCGIQPTSISLSSQELPQNFKDLYDKGIEFNACSLNQLETFGKLFPGKTCGVRFNPGKGSGGTGKTNVGGPDSSFGIWHEQIDKVQEIVKKYNIKVIRIHTHIGSGSDPVIWQNIAVLSLQLVKQFPTVTTLNLGGGYKVGRMSYEYSTDLQKVGLPVKDAFIAFEKDDGRKLKLEIEPGTFLVANAGALLCSVQDLISTESSGDIGHKFIKLDSGMTEVLRPSLYGAQHPIIVHKDCNEYENYIVVGHCCESGDLFSCAPGEPETLKARSLKKVEIGDIVSIEGAGAYCSGMSTKNYNSFPEAAEVMIDTKKNVHLIRKRQVLDQIIQNEVKWNM